MSEDENKNWPTLISELLNSFGFFGILLLGLMFLIYSIGSEAQQHFIIDAVLFSSGLTTYSLVIWGLILASLLSYFLGKLRIFKKQKKKIEELLEELDAKNGSLRSISEYVEEEDILELKPIREIIEKLK